MFEHIPGSMGGEVSNLMSSTLCLPGSNSGDGMLGGIGSHIRSQGDLRPPTVVIVIIISRSSSSVNIPMYGQLAS